MSRSKKIKPSLRKIKIKKVKEIRIRVNRPSNKRKKPKNSKFLVEKLCQTLKIPRSP